jgi:photoactive yellow protein
MPKAAIQFDASNLAAQVERASQDELNNLPFGVVLLDREGTVLFYSATEARQSGYGMSPLGQNFFAISRCRNKGDLREQLLRAMEMENADIEFAWSGDYDAPTREMRIRVQSASRGGIWMFVEREPDSANRAA